MLKRFTCVNLWQNSVKKTASQETEIKYTVKKTDAKNGVGANVVQICESKENEAGIKTFWILLERGVGFLPIFLKTTPIKKTTAITKAEKQIFIIKNPSDRL